MNIKIIFSNVLKPISGMKSKQIVVCGANLTFTNNWDQTCLCIRNISSNM